MILSQVLLCLVALWCDCSIATAVEILEVSSVLLTSGSHLRVHGTLRPKTVCPESGLQIGSTPLSLDVTAHDSECLSVSGKLFKSLLAQNPYSLRGGAWFVCTAISAFSAFDTISSKGVTHIMRYSGKAEAEVGSSRGVMINFHLADSVENIGRLDGETAGVESVLNRSPSVRSYADVRKPWQSMQVALCHKATCIRVPQSLWYALRTYRSLGISKEAVSKLKRSVLCNCVCVVLQHGCSTTLVSKVRCLLRYILYTINASARSRKFEVTLNKGL